MRTYLATEEATHAARRGVTIQHGKVRLRAVVDAVGVSLVLCLVIALVWPELRVSGSGFEVAFQNKEGYVAGPAGYPRVVELLALVNLALWLPMSVVTVIRNHRLHRASLLAIIFVGLCAVSYGWHGGSTGVLRSGIVLPCILFVALANAPRLGGFLPVILMGSMVAWVASAVMMTSQPYMHFVLPQIATQSASGEVAYRFAGLGQAYAYQSAYLCMGVAVCVSLIGVRQRRVSGPRRHSRCSSV